MENLLEMQCVLQTLTKLGINPKNAAEWYDAIYVNPDLSYVKSKTQEIKAKIAVQDIVRLTEQYIEFGFESGMQSTTDYFCNLLNVYPKVRFMKTVGLLSEYKRYGNTFHYYAEFGRGQIVKSGICISDPSWRNRTVREYLTPVAHEVWHAYQTMHGHERLKRGAQGMPCVSPADVPHDLLYAINMHHVIPAFKKSETAYFKQIWEKEAYVFCYAVERYIDQILAAALCRGEFASQILWYGNVPIPN